ncbi:NirD/YgiW/YdeI family stress tolerance protein [Parahaliea mediterranea]|uniref:NirD/YgiW/YdeI family stress tolerance protein n=1 Tax=Parahaliea mediterranea TaxID=651086 RepID=UPI000E2EB9AB|nr:NirD/YgiW/YdeI family stress tolerance protein [Parahaliea mediterranea]
MKIAKYIGHWMLVPAIVLLAACATTPTTAVTIAEAQAVADGTEVVVDVRIAQKLDDEEYLVADPSGEITAVIDEDILGKVQLSPSATIRLYGVIDRDEDASTLEVEKLQVLN